MGYSIITDQHVYFWNGTFGLVEASGLSASFISALGTTSPQATSVDTIGHASSPYCDVTTLTQPDLTTPSKNNQAVLLWRRETNQELYYRADGGYTFTKFTPGTLSFPYDSFLIMDAEIQNAQEGIVLIVRFTTNGVSTDQVILVNGVFADLPFEEVVVGKNFGTTGSTLLRVSSLASGSGEVFVHGASMMYRYVG